MNITSATLAISHMFSDLELYLRQSDMFLLVLVILIGITLVVWCLVAPPAILILCDRADVKKPKYRLIGLSGKFGVGKDTAAEWIRTEHPEYKIVPFADALKRVVAIMTNTSYESQFTREGKAHVPPEYQYSVGKYQQIIGQIGREQFHENIWVNIAIKHDAEYKIIPDVRHPNEADAIKAAGGIVIRIVRGGVVLNDGRDATHISETALDNYPFENIVVNDSSLEEFKKKILWML